MIEKGGANDVSRILDEWKKIKDEVRAVWIKNHNIDATFTSIELLLIGILVCVVLLFITMIFLVTYVYILFLTK